MSYDLHIYSKRQPKASDLDAFLSTHSDGTAEGRFKRDSLVLLTAADGVHAEIDGPSRVEAEDLPDAANGAIGASGWLVQISVKPSTEATWPMDLAIHLARAADGVLYDPQEDRVAWPKGFKPRDPVSGEERITEVELDWFTAWSSTDPDLPRRFLDLVRDHAPEALPTRYGGYEPLPFRFAGEHAQEEFVTHWLEEGSSWTPGLSWNATRPSFGGSSRMSTQLDPDQPRPGRPISRFRLSFDGRAFSRDPAFTERMIGLFTSIAGGLDCVYAAGVVHRDVLLKRGREWSDHQTEWGPIPRADRWIGLPAGPTWLAWFGTPYVELVRSSVAQHITSETDNGIVLRLGEEPMDADQLSDAFPPLPLPLIAHRMNKPPAWETGIRYTMTYGPPSQPAQEIPDLPREAPPA